MTTDKKNEWTTRAPEKYVINGKDWFPVSPERAAELDAAYSKLYPLPGDFERAAAKKESSNEQD
jgi:hypothetical protein